MNIAEECKAIADGVNIDKEKEKVHAADRNYPKFLESIRKAASRGEYQISLGTSEDCGKYLSELIEAAGFSVESNNTTVWGSFFQGNYNIWWCK